jgi:hypothetical protein
MKPSDNKLRGGGNSALTALKARCQREFAAENVSATLDQIMAWAAEEKNTNAIIRQRIGEFFQIQLSRDSQLSSFYSWVKLTRKTMEREGKIQHWLECEKLEHPELTDEELFRRGQRKFKLLAIAEEDPDSWATILREETNSKKLQIEERKLVLLEKKAAQLDQVKQVVDSKLSPEEQKKRLKEILK